MLTSGEKLSAKATTKVILVTTVAALSMAAILFVGAADAGTGHQVGAARAAAIRKCSIMADRYSVHDWGNTEIYQYRACMAQHGQQE